MITCLKRVKQLRGDSINSMIDCLLKHKIKSDKKWSKKGTNKLHPLQYDLLDRLDNRLHKFSNIDVFGILLSYLNKKINEDLGNKV